MRDSNGGRSCDDCRRMIEDDQYVAIVFRVGAADEHKTVFHFHRECARRSVVMLVEGKDAPRDIIPLRSNRYGEVVNDDGSWIRRDGACQCLSCGLVLQSSDEQYADPDCPRCDGESDGADEALLSGMRSLRGEGGAAGQRAALYAERDRLLAHVGTVMDRLIQRRSRPGAD